MSQENREGRDLACKWCGHGFNHVEFRAQHEPACIERPSLDSELAAWQALDAEERADFIRFVRTRIPETKAYFRALALLDAAGDRR